MGDNKKARYVKNVIKKIKCKFKRHFKKVKYKEGLVG